MGVLRGSYFSPVSFHGDSLSFVDHLSVCTVCERERKRKATLQISKK